MLSARKQSEDEGDGGVGYASAQKRIKIENAPQDNVKKSSNKRLKDVEICVPIVYGTMAFWLGRKASEYQSHKWTVYVRGASNEDLGAVIKRVEFQLHPSFSNPLRVVKSPPFELSECGWGEFEIAISLFFHSDVCDKKLALIIQLYLCQGFLLLFTCLLVKVLAVPCCSLYVNSYFKHLFFSFFSVPIEDVHEKKRGDTKDHFLSQWFMNFSDADELLKLAAVRQQVQAYIVKLRSQLSLIKGLPQPMKPARGY
ncbi:Transcription initiation factor TFIID subunit 14b [Camellia lanceoleosa]|uniref:Transcription initiation factor TFIID subunit 14b n=1 Tax=Camellia lanceoleosa TaxID=1840588 RepID=A0ACC0IT90_9ERIC|nr:Transcription initiation factor TFIID subunit 14b [Camellia lanceoleosa]